MRAASLVIALALLAGTGATLAQTLTPSIPMTREREKTEGEIAKEKAIEDAYKASLKKIPDAKPTDPWGAIRSEDKPKTAKTQAKAAKKTGTAAN